MTMQTRNMCGWWKSTQNLAETPASGHGAMRHRVVTNTAFEMQHSFA
jgi:hypothetical protein